MSSVVEPRTFAAPKIRQTGILIGDEFRSSVSGKTFATVNPATEEVICQVAEGDAADVDLAVRAARTAFETGPWSRMDGRDRGRLMNKLADLAEKHLDELAALETLDNGKPINDARAADLFGLVVVVVGDFGADRVGQRHRGHEHVRLVPRAITMGADHEADRTRLGAHRVERHPGGAHELAREMEVGHVLVERGLLVGAGFLDEHAVLVQADLRTAEQARHDQAEG